MAATTPKTQAVRKILKPSPVRSGVPGWFRRALLKAFPTAAGDGTTVVSEVKRKLRASWIDHFGSTLWRDQTAFVSEPYHLTLKDLQSVAALAIAIGCDYETDANSFHNPGRTFRIVIFQARATAPLEVTITVDTERSTLRAFWLGQQIVRSAYHILPTEEGRKREEEILAQVARGETTFVDGLADFLAEMPILLGPPEEAIASTNRQIAEEQELARQIAKEIDEILS